MYVSVYVCYTCVVVHVVNVGTRIMCMYVCMYVCIYACMCVYYTAVFVPVEPLCSYREHLN